MGKNVLITGATGFIGKRLINFLKIKKKEIHEEYPPADFFLNNQIEINTSKSKNYLNNKSLN